jgi:hypothetical protein
LLARGLKSKGGGDLRWIAKRSSAGKKAVRAFLGDGVARRRRSGCDDERLADSCPGHHKIKHSSRLEKTLVDGIESADRYAHRRPPSLLHINFFYFVPFDLFLSFLDEVFDLFVFHESIEFFRPKAFNSFFRRASSGFPSPESIRYRLG